MIFAKGRSQNIIIFFTLIRIFVRWHFQYEGFIKLFADKWSAESFLNNSVDLNSYEEQFHIALWIKNESKQKNIAPLGIELSLLGNLLIQR